MGKTRYQRTTVTIPPDLKKRMDAVKEDVNWSAVASHAFEEKLIEIASRKGKQDMNDVIQRLRASKGRCEDKHFKEGETAGRKWAKERAEVDELERLDAWDWNRVFDAECPSAAAVHFYYKLHPERGRDIRAANDFWSNQLGEYGDTLLEDPMFLKGFVNGALDVWHEVKDKL
jgi:hypothetical protein